MQNNQKIVHTDPLFYYEVSFFSKPYHLFTYSSKNELEIGSLILVEFGRSEKVGILWKKNPTPSNKYPIKEIIRKITNPVLNQFNIDLIDFTVKYYHCFLQDILNAVVPSCIRLEKIWMKDNQYSDVGNLEKKQLPLLNQYQQDFVNNIDFNKFQINLLHGITGSGKTRCYQELISLIQQKNTGHILLLVPEINLTHKLKEEIQSIDEHQTQIYHSQITPKQRSSVFKNTLEKNKSFVFLTTRSGVFLPYNKISLIIVDEEHDSSFKQKDSSFRYNAKDLAIKLAQIHECPCILGSATPSLKMMMLANQHKLNYFSLDKRATEQPLPEISLKYQNKNTYDEPLSLALLKEIKFTLDNNQQVLVYLNRRGYVPRLFCPTCKKNACCPSCFSPLILHLKEKKLCCHYCSKFFAPIKKCQSCDEDYIDIGFGTERVKEYLSSCFPDYPSIIVDTDYINTPKKVEEVFNLINSGNPSIIIGTQMIGKGHDWPNVTLGIMMIADYDLDHHLDEKIAQEVIQASGRIGRHIKGKVLLPVPYDFQSSSLISSIIKSDYREFVDIILKQKDETKEPPFHHEAYLYFKSKNISDLLSALRKLVSVFNANDCRGPILDYPMRKNGFWIAYLVINSSTRISREHAIMKLLTNIMSNEFLQKTFYCLDIDP